MSCTRILRALVACEESQAVTIALRNRGVEAYSCDLIPCSGGHPEWHITQDVIPLINGNCTFETNDGNHHKISGKWDLLIAFPPCTYTSNAGACRLYPRKGQLDLDRYAKGMDGRSFFMQFLSADCPHIAVENPVPSKVFEFPEHTQEIQPYQYDIFHKHPYTKKTRLWLRGLPALCQTTPDEKPIGPYVPAGTGRKDRTKYGSAKRGEDAKNRAKTFPGIADAMADQWIKYIGELNE